MTKKKNERNFILCFCILQRTKHTYAQIMPITWIVWVAFLFGVNRVISDSVHAFTCSNPISPVEPHLNCRFSIFFYSILIHLKVWRIIWKKCVRHHEKKLFLFAAEKASSSDFNLNLITIMQYNMHKFV